MTGWIVTLAAAATLAAAQGADGATLCRWAGTPVTPTGWFALSPGITNTPSTKPLAFTATGELAGDRPCHGTMRWEGVFHAGASCRSASTFSVRVHGLRGVRRGEGVAFSLAPAPTVLYDRRGASVGHEAANILTAGNAPYFAQLPCGTPEGLTGASFHSLVVLYE